MQTDIWGGSEWDSMTYKAYASPEIFTDEDKEKYKKYYMLNATILPCKLCQVSILKIMSYIQIDLFLDGRYGLCYWIFVLHNLVNRKLEKPLANLTDVVFRFESARARCGNKNDVKKFNECKKTLPKYKYSDAIIIANNMHEKYNHIMEPLIYRYYRSNDVLDPKVKK